MMQNVLFPIYWSTSSYPPIILQGFTAGIRVSSALLLNALFALIISLVIQLIAIYGGRILFKNWRPERGTVANYGLIVSNSSFIGIPVAEHIYGSPRCCLYVYLSNSNPF